MKLLFCLHCSDLFRIGTPERIATCSCGRSGGGYNADGDTAWHNGEGVLLGLPNLGLAAVIRGVEHDAEMFLYPTDNGKIAIKPIPVQSSSEDILRS